MIATFLKNNGSIKVIVLDIDDRPLKGETVTLPLSGDKVRKTFRVMDINTDYRIVNHEPQIVLGTLNIFVE